MEKDRLGRDVNIGDFLVFSSHGSSKSELGLVIKRSAIMATVITSNRGEYSKQISNTFKLSKGAAYLDLPRKHADKFDKLYKELIDET